MSDESIVSPGTDSRLPLRPTVRHVPTLRWTAGLLAAFCCCVVAAAHGVAPLGLLLVLGASESPGLAALGWLSLLALPVAQRMNHRALYALGLAALGAWWGVAFRYAEIRWLLMITSAPFLFLLVVQLREVTVGVEEEVGQPSREV